ncbi:MAG: amidohydrolase family protein [Thermoanaerobaculia bacterium]|nr:amidohydrolase family protein [Thermoanaerobaculia bacterium]
MRAFLSAALLAALAHTAAAQDRPVAFRGAQIHPISAPAIDDGTLVARDGVIVAVGPSATVDVPADAEIVDVAGKVILPGLVDTHSHVGAVNGGDASAALHPEVRTLDGVDILSDSFKRARAGGITTVNVMSGSGHLMSGQTTYLKLRDGGTKVEDWLFCDDPLTGICGGLKMANGTNSQRAKPFPGTRGKAAAMVRELFVEAVEYRRKLDEAAASDDEEPPKRDLGMEALVQVLRGERIVQHHTHRHDDVLTVIRIAREFGYTPVLHHVSDAAKVAQEIADAGVPVSLTVVDTPGGKEEALGFDFAAAAELERAGADVAFNTDDSILDSRLHLRSAALAVRYGMSRQAALEGLTLAGARMLGLDDRVGSLEVGKDADLVVLSGDPLSVYSKVEETWVEGVKIFDRSLPEHREWAVGGYGVYHSGGAHHDD